jgi:hypothetical protein
MTTYRLSHITDLLQIPPEHWDECMRDLRGAMISLHLVEAAIACAPGASFDPKKDCPFIDFQPDGKGEITPMMNGTPIFSMKVTRDGDAP